MTNHGSIILSMGKKLREGGCRVATYRGNEITWKAEGGATCLTRPVLRDPTSR